MGTLRDVAAEGDRLATLRALRDRLADQLERTDSARDVAALARQMTTVLEQIAVLDPPVRGDAVDEITTRRAARGRRSPARPGGAGEDAR